MAEVLFQELSAVDRRDALEVVESSSSHKANLLEKDIWVVATLNALFNAPFSSHLIFKGGTSLSKVWRVVRRFFRRRRRYLRYSRLRAGSGCRLKRRGATPVAQSGEKVDAYDPLPTC